MNTSSSGNNSIQFIGNDPLSKTLYETIGELATSAAIFDFALVFYIAKLKKEPLSTALNHRRALKTVRLLEELERILMKSTNQFIRDFSYNAVVFLRKQLKDKRNDFIHSIYEVDVETQTIYRTNFSDDKNRVVVEIDEIRELIRSYKTTSSLIKVFIEQIFLPHNET